MAQNACLQLEAGAHTQTSAASCFLHWRPSEQAICGDCDCLPTSTVHLACCAAEWRFLLAGATAVFTAPNPDPSWLTEKAWLELQNLSVLPSFQVGL